MEFFGLGSDIIEVSRIHHAIEEHGPHFLDRLFTKNEQEYCNKFKKDFSAHYAGRFAAKEAIVKALGTGIRGEMGWKDIEIINDDLGKPIVTLSERALRFFNNPVIHLTISHCKEYATATAVALTR